MKKIILFLLCLLPLSAAAEDYLDLKGALKALLPAGQAAFKSTVRLDAAGAKTLNDLVPAGHKADDEIAVYYTKDAAGRVSAMAVELREVLKKYAALHRWVIAFGPDKKLLGLAVTKLSEPHSFGIAGQAFQAQFRGKDPTQLALGRTVDAVAGATESADMLLQSIKKAFWIIGQARY